MTRISEYGVWGVRKNFEYGPNEAFFAAETDVLATGYKSENKLGKELEGEFPVDNVGDSVRPGMIKDAIRGGFIAAQEL